MIRNLLILNGYNTAIALSTFDEDSFHESQEFMRSELVNEIIEIPDESKSEYFGAFHKSPTKFTILGGQTRIIKILAKACKHLYEEKTNGNATLLPRGM